MPRVSFFKKPKLSVVIVFHNMRREAKRTLYSLMASYQKDVTASDYEVIAIDSNSTEPLDGRWVESIQDSFRYRFVKTEWPSPCRAMNTGIQMSRADHVVCMIDGARILSPGVLSKMILLNSLYEASFIQTIAMHIGHEMQNVAVEKGYDQRVEDELIASVDWQTDGYRLFDISCLAGSSKNGFLFPIPESNCFCAPKRRLVEIGGFDEGFTSLGGGIVNHDVLNKLLCDDELTPVMLLGEASFHQFHGGVMTNVPRAENSMQTYLQEYRELRGKEYQPVRRNSVLFGEINQRALRFVINPAQ